MDYASRALVLGAFLFVSTCQGQPLGSQGHHGNISAAAEPHCGPVCQADEHVIFYSIGDVHICSTTCSTEDDCPTDVPPGMTGAVWCAGNNCLHHCGDQSERGYPAIPYAICYGDPGDASICAYADSSDAGCKLSGCMNPGCFKVYGSWVQISESSGKQQVTFEQGVSRTYEVDDTTTWGEQVTASVKTGFNLKVFSKEVTVTGEASDQLSASYKQTFGMSTTTTFQYSFDAGIVWQWQWQSDEACGTSITMGKDLVLTDGAFDPPCCVPGYFKDITEPHGECHATPDGGVYSFCNETNLRVDAGLIV